MDDNINLNPTHPQGTSTEIYFLVFSKYKFRKSMATQNRSQDSNHFQARFAPTPEQNEIHQDCGEQRNNFDLYLLILYYPSQGNRLHI